MPRPKRPIKVRRPDLTTLTQVQRDQLITGHDTFQDAFHDDIETMRVAWAIHGREITVAYIVERPGARPWGWWRFDAPEPRRQLDASVEGSGPADWFGCPRLYTSAVKIDEAFEMQLDYLRRHGLLTPSERRALGR
jgi:hypothetical protein